MKVAIVGSGAVGGFYGAQLARAGHEVAFLARGAHLDAVRSHGLTVRGALGEWTVHGLATSDPADVGPADLVLVAVKTYDNRTAMPMLAPLTARGSLVLTLQNGVDSPDEAAAVCGSKAVLAGAAYIATAVTAPGLIEQTGTHRRIVFGEAFGDRHAVSDRASRLRDVLTAADVDVEVVADGRAAIWEKLIYLAPFAAFTGAARLPIGRIWGDDLTRRIFMMACLEVESVARAEGVPVAQDTLARIDDYMKRLPPATRSSLLIDLSAGKRIEVEALLGAVVRRAELLGLPVPIAAALYAVLRPHATPPGPGAAGAPMPS